MMDSNDWAMIRREIARQVSVVLHGQTAATNVDDAPATESIDNCPPGTPTITGRPVMHPYGLVSRAIKETISVVARVGNHPANLMVVGHRDKNRPALGADGEVALYDSTGNQIHLKDGKIVVKLQSKMEIGEGATKGAARKDDQVKCYIPSGAVIISVVAGAGTPNPNPIECDGTITQASANVTIAD